MHHPAFMHISLVHSPLSSSAFCLPAAGLSCSYSSYSAAYRRFSGNDSSFCTRRKLRKTEAQYEQFTKPLVCPPTKSSSGQLRYLASSRSE